MIDLDLFIRYLVQKLANSPLSSLWYSETVRDNATILCKNLVKIGPVVSAEKRLIEIALHVDVGCGSTYFVEYLRIYWTDIHNLFTV